MAVSQDGSTSPQRLTGNRAAVAVILTILVIYLASMIGVAYLGQVRLRDALILQEQLDVEKVANDLAYFLGGQQDAVTKLSRSPQISAFLANRDLGIAMRYGLRDSLLDVEREFERAIRTGGAARKGAFDSLSFIEVNGRVLVAVGATADAHSSYQIRDVATLQRMISLRSGRAWIQFSTRVRRKGETMGYVVGEMEATRTLLPLVDRHPAHDHEHHTTLLGPGNQIVVSSGDSDHLHHGPGDGAGTTIETRVGETPLRLIRALDDALHQGILTSPLFLVALGLLALPILLGAIYLWRLNSHNLVLKTRYEATSQQQATLQQQNERLQREINKRMESEEKLAHQANFDQLTGLPNRNLALDRLAQAVKRAKREDGRVLTLFLDLDRFKQVNDSLGHAAGDELLREAAQRLSNAVRESDTVSRLGGDEFLVICSESGTDSDWEQCPQQLLKALSAPFYIGDHEFFVGASIGAALYPEAGSEPQKLLKNADIAMYAAKEQGRNRYCSYDPSMDVVAMEGVRLERNLRHALKRREFYLVFQPIVELSSGRTVALEALLRWRNEELGEVTPDRFIPIAEETGLIHEIGEWVLHEACSTLSRLQLDSRLRLAVNLSPKQFSRPSRLLDCVLNALRDSGLMPNQLELEITETILIDDRAEIFDLINQLDRIGVRLSIDDFGTGYSALNYLQRFPFDVLKIDRSFTRQVPDSRANVSLIRAIIAMAHALDLEVVAEGIEHREQAGFLLVYHCEYGQGFLYSKPLEIDELAALLTGNTALSA